MSTYLISDIHGNNLLFRKALKSVNLRKNDVLIILGDLIDRGPDSKKVLDTIFLLLEHDFNITCIKGNHEKMFLDSFKDVNSKINWIRNGGNETLSSFLTSEIEKIPKKYIELIESFKTYIEIDEYILVHAGLNMKIDDPFEDQYSLMWLRDWEGFINKEWLGNRKIIHGHTPLKKDLIQQQLIDNKQIICIDNGSYLKESGYGGLCVLRLDDMKLYFEK
jgi:serine/threonine protein phosphatase 1